MKRIITRKQEGDMKFIEPRISPVIDYFFTLLPSYKATWGV